MRVVFLAVGRLRPYYREAADDYRRRLGRFADIEEREVREYSNAERAERQLVVEAERLVKQLPKRTTVVALTREGRQLTSEDVAERLGGWVSRGLPVTFLIGGSHGLDTALKQRADDVWSLGPMTLPHELARVVAYEQVYRGFTIMNRMPYHKGGAR